MTWHGKPKDVMSMKLRIAENGTRVFEYINKHNVLVAIYDDR